MKHRPEGISNADGFCMVHRRLMMFRAEVTMNSSAVNGTLGLYINSLMVQSNQSAITSDKLEIKVLLLFSSVSKPMGSKRVSKSNQESISVNDNSPTSHNRTK